MTWPAVVLWLLIAAGAVSRGPLILYLFSGTAIFGGLTMAPAGLTGGLNVPAQTVCAAVLIVKIFLSPGNLALALRHAFDMRKLGLLTMFCLYMVMTSLLYPRIFEGAVQLYSLNAAGSLSALAPTSANFTQTIYLLISAGMVFAFGIAGRNESFRALYLRSIMLAGVLLVASGVIDSVAGSLGRESWLAPFHNATYNLLSAEKLAGQKRVVGFMPEASVFGLNCCVVLSFLVFNFQEYERRWRRFFLPALIAVMIYMIYLSTSSTGFVGFFVLAAVYGADSLARMFLVPLRTASSWRRIWFALGGVLMVAGAFVLLPSAVKAHVNAVLNVVVFHKSTTASYLERHRWTAAGLAAFWATHGVGVGSVRTSNWFVNFLASTGVVGVLLFGAFVLKMMAPFAHYPDASFSRFARRLRYALLPAVAMIEISGTTPDPGVWVMSIIGLMYGLHVRPAAAGTMVAAPPVRAPRLDLRFGKS